MTETVAFEEDDGTVIFEVSGAPGAVSGANAGSQIAKKASKSLNTSLMVIGRLLKKLDTEASAPNVTELEVSFTLKMTSEGHFIVASAGGEASLTVTAKISRNS